MVNLFVILGERTDLWEVTDCSGRQNGSRSFVSMTVIFQDMGTFLSFTTATSLTAVVKQSQLSVSCRHNEI